MVDLALLQSVSYIAGALGVSIAAVYYVMNLRETTKNRRANLSQMMMQEFTSIEGFNKKLKLYEMKWTDFDDYYKKYDSQFNSENAAIRNNIWDNYDVLAHWWREDIVDRETIFSVCGPDIAGLWVKFKPVIEEYRRRGEYARTKLSNWEYLAKEMARMRYEQDPSWKAGVYINREDYDKAFKS